MMAKKKPVDQVDGGAGETKLETVTMSYPPERPEGRIIGEGTEAVPELVRLLRQEAKVLD